MEHKPNSGEHAGKNHKKSSLELLSSAKVVAEAAKATLHHDSGKVDKGRVSDAAADLLGAAKVHGKFEEKAFGKYVDKAEAYLHKYSSSHAGGGGGGTGIGGAAHTTKPEGEHNGMSKSDYLKLAQGFLKKH